jgi:hypothetical protein
MEFLSKKDGYFKKDKEKVCHKNKNVTKMDVIIEGVYCTMIG